jgi:hypothetical protein
MLLKVLLNLRLKTSIVSFFLKPIWVKSVRRVCEEIGGENIVRNIASRSLNELIDILGNVVYHSYALPDKVCRKNLTITSS